MKCSCGGVVVHGEGYAVCVRCGDTRQLLQPRRVVLLNPRPVQLRRSEPRLPLSCFDPDEVTA
jgi:hypothetical protein